MNNVSVAFEEPSFYTGGAALSSSGYISCCHCGSQGISWCCAVGWSRGYTSCCL